MKKTLIAIAALAATGAFAQSSVQIDGTMDMGLQMATVQVHATALAAAGPVAPAYGGFNKTNSFSQNGSATSALNIRGTEDLGAGMKAMFLIETNPDMSGSVSPGTPGAVNSGAGGTAFGGGERFVGLSGDFGSIKMGAPNSAALQIIGMSNPFGTALGGGYGGAGFSRIGAAATTSNVAAVGTVGAQTRIIRAEKSIRYDSANFGGFAGSFNYGFANTAANGTGTTLGVQTIGLTYSAGPLNAGFTTTSIKNAGGVTQTAAAATGNPGLTLNNVLSSNANASTTTGNFISLNSGESVSYNAFAANYTFGATTVYGGYTTNKRNVATLEDGSSTNIAVRHMLTGALALSGNYVKRSDNNAAGANAKLLGLGLDYALSKRTSAYARYEKFDLVSSLDSAGESKVYAFGVRHTF